MLELKNKNIFQEYKKYYNDEKNNVIWNLHEVDSENESKLKVEFDDVWENSSFLHLFYTSNTFLFKYILILKMFKKDHAKVSHYLDILLKKFIES